jgi:hypothetical protein
VKIASGLLIYLIQSPYRIEIVLPSDRRIILQNPVGMPQTRGVERLPYLDGLRVLALRRYALPVWIEAIEQTTCRAFTRGFPDKVRRNVLLSKGNTT